MLTPMKYIRVSSPCTHHKPPQLSRLYKAEIHLGPDTIVRHNFRRSDAPNQQHLYENMQHTYHGECLDRKESENKHDSIHHINGKCQTEFYCRDMYTESRMDTSRNLESKI